MNDIPKAAVSKIQILIVSNAEGLGNESDFEGPEVLRSLLEVEGYDAKVVLTSDMAVHVIDLLPVPSLVIFETDIRDSKGNIVPMLQLHKQLTQRARQPIITLSYASQHSDEFKIIASAAGISCYLTKLEKRYNEKALKLLLSEVSQRAGMLKQMSDPLVDPITGGANRNYGDKQLIKAIRRARRVHHVIKCAFIDLNKFKAINDTYGHHIGDQVLHDVYVAIKGILQKSDLLYRVGGDEFLIFQLNATNRRVKESIDLLGEAISRAVSTIVVKTGDPTHPTIQVQAAVGVSVLTAVEIEEALSEAVGKAMGVSDESRDLLIDAACTELANRVKNRADARMYENKDTEGVDVNRRFRPRRSSTRRETTG